MALSRHCPGSVLFGQAKFLVRISLLVSFPFRLPDLHFFFVPHEFQEAQVRWRLAKSSPLLLRLFRCCNLIQIPSARLKRKIVQVSKEKNGFIKIQESGNIWQHQESATNSEAVTLFATDPFLPGTPPGTTRRCDSMLVTLLTLLTHHPSIHGSIFHLKNYLLVVDLSL